MRTGSLRRRRLHATSLICGFTGVMLSAVPLSAQSPATPTFTKDVAPILQRSCVSCHRPGEVAPMSLQTYKRRGRGRDRSRPASRARKMPPWFIDKTRRHPGVQERSVASRERHRDDRRLGRRGRAAGQSGRHACPSASFRASGAWAIGKPDLDCQVPGHQGAGGWSRSVSRGDRANRPDRGSLCQSDSDPGRRLTIPDASCITPSPPCSPAP